MISELLGTNQIAILIDFADPEFNAWLSKILVDNLKLQVDAIYCLNHKKTSLLIDITQIVDDFRLFSEF